MSNIQPKIIFKSLKAKNFKLFKILSIIIAFILGGLFTLISIEVKTETSRFSGEYFISAKVVERTAYSSSDKLVVTLDNVCVTNLKTLEKEKIKGKVRLYLEESDLRTKEFELGEKITATAELINVKLFEKDRNNFSLINRGIYVIGFASEENIISENKVEASLSEKFKTKVKTVLDTYSRVCEKP